MISIRTNRANKLDDKKKQITATILKQREESFREFIDIVFAYAKSNELVVVEEDYTYILYSSQALYDANELANEFAEKTSFVVMKSVVPRLLFEVAVNFVSFVRIYDVRLVRDVNIITQLGERIPGIQPSRDVLYLSKEIEIIKIYNNLYDFTREKDWDDLFEKEEELFLAISGDSRESLTKANTTGGAQPDKQKQLQLFKLLMDVNCIFIGIYGASFITNVQQNSKIQIITDDIKQTTETIITLLASIGINATVKIDKSFEMIEYRMNVTIIELEGTIFVEIFNSANYELLMCKKINGARIAHPLIICKFLFLELFKFRLLYFAQRVNKQVYDAKKAEVISIVRNIRRLTFEEFDVYGTYYDEAIAIKNSQFNSFKPYYPRKELIKEGKYRKIIINKEKN